MRRLWCGLLTIVAASTLLNAAADSALNADGVLRPLDSRASGLLAVGPTHSETFRALVDRLIQSDLIVYIEVQPFWRGPHGSALHFMTATGDRRFIRISLRAANTNAAAIAWLAHELQHAVEIADHAEVINDEDRKSTRLNSSHLGISYAVFCLKKK